MIIKFYESNGTVYATDNDNVCDYLINEINSNTLDLSDTASFYKERYHMPLTGELISIRNAIVNCKELLRQTHLLILPIK